MIESIWKSGVPEILKIVSKNREIQPSKIVESTESVSIKTVYERLDELVKVGILSVRADLNEYGKPIKLYTLTPTGRRILELLEEIERVLQEGYGEDKEVKEMEEEIKRF